MPEVSRTPLGDAIDKLSTQAGVEIDLRQGEGGAEVSAGGSKSLGKGWTLSGAYQWAKGKGSTVLGKLRWTPK